VTVDQNTGEVQEKGFAIKRGAELLTFEPTNPAEMERFIREAVGLLEEMPDVMLEINDRRYAAERAYSRKKNEHLAGYGKSGVPATFARAQAEVDSLAELETWHNTKAEYHFAEKTEQALRTKVYSMLNINRAIAAQYGVHR
jgi:hypothetical protein